MKALYVSVVSAGLLCAVHSSATAHDPGPPSDPSKYKWKDSRDKYPPIDRHVAASSQAGINLGGAAEHPFFVIVLPNRWATSARLRICFEGGSDDIRSKILSVGSEWLKYANLQFVTGGPAGQTCMDKDSSEIRIGFSEPGYWAYIGNDGIQSDLVDKNLPSMNFEGFDSSPIAEPRFSGVILHEFGHALGFHHEHQSPAEGCDKEYDWPTLLKVYHAAYGWDEQMTRDNLKTLDANHTAYDWSNPDRKSIMIYGTPDPSILKLNKASPCYFTDNNVLSDLDKEGAQQTYPFSDAHEHLVAQQNVLETLIPLATGSLKEALTSQSKTVRGALEQ